MAVSKPKLINSDEQPVFDALLEAKVRPKVAYTAVRRVSELAAQNIGTLIEARFDAMDAKFDAKFNAMDAKFDAKFNAMDAKFNAMDAKFNAMDAKFNAKFDAAIASTVDLKDHLRRDRAMLWAVIALLGAAMLRTILMP